MKQRDFKENIKHQIPDTGLEKLKRVFKSFDREEKGFLTIEDFKEALKSFFTVNDIEKIFKEHCDKSEKSIFFLNFLQMILPPGSNFDVNVNRIRQYDPRFTGYPLDLSLFRTSYLRNINYD